MDGYWRLPEKTAEAMRGGWLHSGDSARTDADGFLYIAGRIKDLIISGGENIYPIEVERLLRQHPGVREVADCRRTGCRVERVGIGGGGAYRRVAPALQWRAGRRRRRAEGVRAPSGGPASRHRGTWSSWRRSR